MTHFDSAPEPVTTPGPTAGTTRKRNVNKAKGTKAETAVVEFLRNAGFVNAERRALRGTKDCGDITGIPGLVVEVKDHGRDNLAGWVEEANVERRNAYAAWGVVIHKRRGKANPRDWFVTCDGATFAALLRSAYGLTGDALTDEVQIPGQLSLLDEGAA